MGKEFLHVSVLLSESIESLNIKPNGIYVDCTTGGGGHSLEIAKRLDFNKGRLICFDRDSEAIEAAKKTLSSFPVEFVNDKFSAFSHHISQLGVECVDGVLMDLGVSSYQLDNARRGFSFHENAALDMRMCGKGLSAYDVVNFYEEDRIAEILFKYGEEKYARGIAKGIVREREKAPIQTTGELAEIIRTNVPIKVRKEKNPCRKTFQAIRIEVNDELGEISSVLPIIFDHLSTEGRLSVISFHSLEDRIVKNTFRELSKGCVCPPTFPICVCNKIPAGEIITKKPILPKEDEIENNPRSRSAKLRIIKKIL